ncbi:MULTISPECIES: hypothetical protein [unclassified Bradyrhizobium]|uniref:hypothetical protein n=1 Tax=unclassified Bradyrhizobium TaxID=2631580 RepID=UPI0028F0499F|nr:MULTISPECIES: hypothetical protein [unclassified Bradyrhizobium]
MFPSNKHLFRIDALRGKGRRGFEQVMEAAVGVLVVSTIAKIRRAYFVHGQPVKAICRELGVSCKVVREVIGSEVFSPET